MNPIQFGSTFVMGFKAINKEKETALVDLVHQDLGKGLTEIVFRKNKYQIGVGYAPQDEFRFMQVDTGPGAQPIDNKVANILRKVIKKMGLKATRSNSKLPKESSTNDSIVFFKKYKEFKSPNLQHKKPAGEIHNAYQEPDFYSALGDGGVCNYFSKETGEFDPKERFSL